MGKNLTLILCSVAIGFGLSQAINCRTAQRARNFTVNPGFNKIVPMLNTGDNVEWFDSKGQPMDVQFQLKSPCKGDAGLNTKIKSCNVVASTGKYIFDCFGPYGCDDPEWPVEGLDFWKNLNTIRRPDTATGFHKYLAVACVNNTASATAQKAKAGDSFQWDLTGPDAKWTVTVNPNTCQEGQKFGNEQGDDLNRLCTLLDKAKTQDHYMVHVENCTDGTASLKIP